MRSEDRCLAMPNLDQSEPTAAHAGSGPFMQPTITRAKHSLQDLFTGGWRRPLTGLPTSLGRPLARWTAAGKSRLSIGPRRHSADG
jgi:hypothetical protein